MTERRGRANPSRPSRALLLAGAALAAASCGTSSALPAGGGSALASGACARDALCFNIVPPLPASFGPVRLLVRWNWPNEKGEPDIVELARLSGTERSVTVPLAAIRAPRPASMDRGMSWGYVFAVLLEGPDDVNAAAGTSQMMLVHAVSGWHVMAALVRDKFPAGVADGTAAYVMTPGRGHFDDFVLAPPGTVFDLVFCPATQLVCNLPRPNPS